MTQTNGQKNMPGRRLLTAASVTLMTVGAGLMLYYGSSVVLSARANQHGLDAFASARGGFQRTAAIIERRAPLVIDADTGLAVPDRSDWSDKRISDYEALRAAGLLDDLPTGVMRIPSISLELPLYDGTEEKNLTRGAGVIEGTAPLGTADNTGLAAHRDGYFRSLKDVTIGDEIHVETLDDAFTYRISEIFIVSPEDIYVLDPSEVGQLTLVTCYPFYFIGSAPQRYIVRAEMI